MNSVEIRDKKKVLLERGKAIVNICKSEVRDMTEEEQSEYNDIIAQVEALNEELKALQDRLNAMEEPKDPEEGEETEEAPSEEEGEDEDNKEEKNDKRMKKQFNLLKAINDVVNRRSFDKGTEAYLNEQKRSFTDAGISVAGQIQFGGETRTIKVKDASETDKGIHDDVIEVDFKPIVENLYANSALAQKAKVITGCKNDIQYPVMSKGTGVGFKSELAEADAHEAGFTHKTFKPLRLSCVVTISRQLLLQDSVGVQNALINDIQNAMAAKFEEVLLGTGAGDENTPAGIFNGKTKATLTDWASVTDFEANLDAENVNNATYIISPKAKAKFRALTYGGKSTRMVMDSPNEIDGTEAAVTSNLTGTDVVYGDFSQYGIFIWGGSGVDILVDDVTRAKWGEVNLICSMYCNGGPLRDEAFEVASF